MKKLNIDLFFGFFILIIIIILKYKALSLPYFWDGLNYMIETINYLYQNTITPFLWEHNLGHPPFFFMFVGILFKILGESTIIANSIVLFFSFLALYFTYLIGKELFNRKVGIVASLTLLFTPIFFSYSALLLLVMPLTAFTVMTIYFAIKDKPLLYFIFGSLLVLTEMTGILIIMGIVLSKLIKEKKINKDLIIYSLPSLTFLLWIISNKLYYGHFFYPIITSLLTVHIIRTSLNLLMILKIIFFDQYRWIVTSIFLVSFIRLKDLRKNVKKTLLFVIISSLFFIFLYNSDIILKFLMSNYPNAMRYYPNITNYFNIIKVFGLLFSVLVFILLSSHRQIFDFIKNKKHTSLIIIFLLVIFAYSFLIPISPRYFLFIFPILFLFYAFAITTSFKKYYYVLVILIIIVFSLNFTGNRSSVGFTLETNMEYVDFIKTHQLAVSYIENNFPNTTVLTAFPQSSELQYTYGKYVKNSIKVITISPQPGITGYLKNYTSFIDQDKLVEPEINLSEIDLYYYSPQEFQTKGILDIAKQLNLTLIKRFELNNKSTEIYIVNK